MNKEEGVTQNQHGSCQGRNRKKDFYDSAKKNQLETYKIKCPVVFLKLLNLKVSLEGQESLPPPLPVLVLACELVHVPPALDRFRSQDISFCFGDGTGEEREIERDVSKG